MRVPQHDRSTTGRVEYNVSDEGKRSYRGALRAYLEQIRPFRLLTESGEYRLAVDSRAGDEAARNRLLEANLRLVVKIALEYRHSPVKLEDLIAEGNVGLIQAVKRFDPNRGVRFVSYASWWVRKYMVAALNDSTKAATSPLPRGASMAVDERTKRARVLSLEDFLHNSGDRVLLEKVAPRNEEDPEHLVVASDLQEALRSVLERIPALERRVLEMHYGLDGAPPRTLQVIGQELRCTREHVRQIELRARDRARRLLER
jgi:RNA polymerase sigma factor (sigma-70 family)